MIEGETRGEETHGHNKSLGMGRGQRRRICAWWLWVSACLQAASLKPWATQGGFDDKRVGSQGLDVDRDTPTHLIGLYFGLGAKRPPKGLRHHTHITPRPVVAMGQSSAPIPWGGSAAHLETRFQTMRITYFAQWINMCHFNRSSGLALVHLALARFRERTPSRLLLHLK
jgi:hypothetical protein